MTKYLKNCFYFAPLVFALPATAENFAIDDFSSGLLNGGSGNWINNWTSAVSPTSPSTASTISTSAASGALVATRGGTANSTVGSVSRQHTATTTVPLTISFDFTIGEFPTVGGTAAQDRFELYGGSTREGGVGATNSWIILGGQDLTGLESGLGANWIFHNGKGTGNFENGTAGENSLVDSGIALVLGNTYRFTILDDPSTGTYIASVDNLDDLAGAFTTGSLGYRGLAAVNPHIQFGARLSTSGDTAGFTVDNVSIVLVAPALVTTVPADNATNVALDANLTATFTESVVAGTGNIELWQVGGGSPVESFDVDSSPRLTFSGATLTIDPTANLTSGVEYYVLIPATAVVDTTGGDAFAGISDPTAWNFTGDNPLDGTWNVVAAGVTSHNWTDTGMWVSGQIADGADFTANFTGIDITGNKTVSLNGFNRTIGNITFTDATTPSNKLIISGNTLTLERTPVGAVPVITVTNQEIEITSILAGNDGLVKTGAGGLRLNGTNNLTGGLTINAGSLISQGTVNRLGTNLITLGDVANTDAATNLSVTFSGPFSNNINVRGNGVNVIQNFGGAGSTFSGAIDLGGNLLFNDRANSTTANVISGVISGTGNFSFLNRDNTVTNVLTLSNANTFTGKTTITSGILSLTNANALQKSYIDTTASATGDANDGLRTNQAALNLGGLSGNKNLASIFTTTTGGYGSVTAITLDVATGNNLDYSGAITDGRSLTKTGAGTQVLSGANTYTGDTTVNAGVLAVTGSSIADTGKLVIDGSGKVDLTNTETVATLFLGAVEQPAGNYSETSVPLGATITTASFTGAGTLTVGAAPTNTFANWISNPVFGLAVADQDLGDDPDGDGTGNGVENFFGTNPGTFTQGLLVGIKSGNTFTFTHPQNATPASDLTASYRWSKDLASFLASGATDGAGTTVTFTTQADTPSLGITTVTATVTGTATSKLFVRVNVTQP